MNIKTVIFDLDGTLADTSSDLAAALNYTLDRHGYPIKSEAEVKSLVGDGVKALISKALLHPLPASDINSLYGEFMDYYSEHCTDRSLPYDGIPELLHTLKEYGCKLAVVTNKPDVLLDKILSSLFDSVFDAAVGFSDSAPPKPDPASTMSVMERLCVTAGECVFIGDSDTDVKTAHNSQMTAIGAAWGFRSVSVLQSAGADYIVSSPLEVLEILKLKRISKPYEH